MISPPLDGDNRNWYGAQMHNIWFLQTLGKALTDAREGRLTVDWRDRLTTPYDNPEPAVVLAVEEIREMPLAAWEPGHAPDWRRALDAWYATGRVVLASRYSHRTQSTLKLVEMTARNLTHVLHPTQPLEEYLRTTVDKIDESSDSTLGKQYDGYVRDRDILRADYLSGLCAGGQDHDWIGWLRARVETWREKQVADAYRLRMSTSSFRTVKERLPEYWTNT